MTKSYAPLTALTDAGYLGTGLLTNLSYGVTLLRMLENASEEIDHICFRHFDCWEGTYYFDGSGFVLIPNEDILSISEFKLDIDGDATFETTLATTDYILYPTAGQEIFPKTYIKPTMSNKYGGFAAGIRSGVKITGVFGHGDGLSATPYTNSGVVVNTGGISGTEVTHALATNKGVYFGAGMTVRIDSEQIYITNVTTDTLTFERPMNGTAVDSHTAGVKIYIYRYPGPVVEATLILATAWWKQRENPATFMAGDSISGQYTITKDIDDIIRHRLDHHIKRQLR